MQHGAMPPVRILVVEDEPLIRLFVADILEDAGFTVEEAANATEAIERLAPNSVPFDAIIIDVGLPDQRGDRLADEIRRMWKELPIVIASGHDKNVLAQSFAGDDRVRVLGKPFYGDMLLAALKAMGVGGSEPAGVP
jgi:DNA-binding response OmpR family regulator